MLQQCLPFTVLKLYRKRYSSSYFCVVATVLTVYGIETPVNSMLITAYNKVATVLTVYGIETS